MVAEHEADSNDRPTGLPGPLLAAEATTDGATPGDANGGPWYRRPAALYGLALFALALAALGLALLYQPGQAAVGWWQAVFFVSFSLFCVSIGYPHPALGHVSFDRIAQVFSVLVLGPVNAAWIAGLVSLAYPLHRLRKGVAPAKVLEACITNAGLMTLVVLGAGLLYQLLGGPVPLQSLGLRTFGLLLFLILGMQVLNELGMILIFLSRSKRPSEVVSVFETLTELVSGLIAILVAIVYTRLETAVFVLLLAVLAAGMVSLKQFADMRRHLEQLVEARTEKLRVQGRELERLATHDTLTGLRNRRYAEEFLQRELDQADRYGHELSVALADIDHFKDINDGHSHAVGDRVLARIGQIFRERIRHTDLVARYGGEEFLFCFTGTPEAMAAQVCEDLRRAVEGFDWSTVSPALAVTISIGVAGRTPGTTPQDLVARADARMYRAKHLGRNLVVAETTVTRASL